METIAAWTIYVFDEGGRIIGAAPVVTQDGIKDIFHTDCTFTDKKEAFRAKVKVKNQLQNTLNVINWYGKEVLDPKTGDVSIERYEEQETRMAIVANQVLRDLNDLRPFRKYPVKNISLEQAKKWKLI